MLNRVLAAVLAVLGGAWLGCETSRSDKEFVARVDDSYLHESDVIAALTAVPAGLDSTHAAEQVVDRWITDELLSQEAVRRGLPDNPDVQRRLEDNERALLISILIDLLYQEVDVPTDREITAYFERNKDNLPLREPFLRIRYLSTPDSADAQKARAILDSTSALNGSDSLWSQAITDLAFDPEASTVLSTNYFPASRLFRNVPRLFDAVSPLGPGESTVILSDDGTFHVIQLVERVRAGTTPKLEWIVDEIRNRILISKRKQMYIDQVQRLRNKALARGLLEVRE